MADLQKHRREKDTFSVSFDNLLDSGAGLTGGTASVTVTKPQGSPAGWKDVSSEFGSPSGTVSGSDVQFTLDVAGTDEQEAMTYVVRIDVDADNGDKLTATATLEVLDEGDEDAP